MSAGEGSALVTGASRGIGRAIALRLARDGYEVIGVARGRGALDALRDEIVAAGGRCRPLAVCPSYSPDTTPPPPRPHSALPSNNPPTPATTAAPAPPP